MNSADRFEQYALIIRMIPEGKIATYGQIAAMAGFPRHSREVGRFLAHNSVPLPWHRVVNAQGRLSLEGDRGEVQRFRLEKEGVKLMAGKVNLSNYQWLPYSS